MEEQQKDITADWRENVTPQAEVFKLADGEKAELILLDEGITNIHVDYGTSIMFKVKDGEKEKVWYVPARNFSLLGAIKELGTLTNLKVKVERIGARKSDTRYYIVKA